MAPEHPTTCSEAILIHNFVKETNDWLCAAAPYVDSD